MHTFSTQAILETSSEFNQSMNCSFTTIREASPDGFNAGSSYRVKSSGPLGAAGTHLDLKIQLKNYAKIERWKDKNTGQPKETVKNNVSFEVLHYQPVVNTKIK
jgi:hypothetical protein